jgi:mannose-6-phosphate isomerase-like protein (cupin superfamily)
MHFVSSHFYNIILTKLKRTITKSTQSTTTTKSSYKMKLVNINFTFITLAAAALTDASSANTDENNSAELCWSGNEDPAIHTDVPFFNSLITEDCKDLEKDEASKKQCGKDFYGKDDNSFLNWVYGTAHADSGFPNWIAMDKVGKSQYAPDGLMFAPFKLGKSGSLRDAHWHPNSAEILFVTGGKARVTVTGLPKTDVAGNLRGATSSVEGKERISETFLVSPGDAVVFPVGYHHYFEGIHEDDPLTGIAIFDTPDLRSFDTPQVMKNIPNNILNRVLSLKDGPHTAEGFYTGSRRVISDPSPTWSPPDSLSDDLTENSAFKVSSIYMDLVPALRPDINGDSATKVVNAQTNTVLDKAGFSIAYTEVQPDASIEPYWMDDADEVIFVIEGDSIDVVRSGNGQKSCLDSFEIEQGFFALNEIGSTWTLTNNGNETAKVLRIFNSNNPSMTTLFDGYESLPEDVINSMMYDHLEDSNVTIEDSTVTQTLSTTNSSNSNSSSSSSSSSSRVVVNNIATTGWLAVVAFIGCMVI